MTDGDSKRSFDEFDNGEGFQAIPPYSLDDESKPKIAVHCDEYHQALQLALSILTPFRETIAASGYTDHVIKALDAKIEAASSLKDSATVSIGLLGDAGTGKSSLMNALLAEPQLAKTGSSGQSCTQVVQCFGPAPPEQQPLFAAEISLLDENAGKELVKQHARNYIHYHKQYGPRAVTKAVIDDDDTEDDERDVPIFEDSDEQDNAQSDAKNDSETALEVLHALFSDHSNFADKDEAATFLSTAKGVDDKAFLLGLEEMVGKLYRSTIKRDCTIVVHADDVDELHTALEPYTKNQTRSGMFDGSSADESTSNNLWPLVLKVRVTFSNPMINEGIVLVDVPGITDVNQQRRRTALKALRECTHYIVTGKIARINSDPNVTRYLKQATETRSLNTVLVATYSDEIDIASDFDCPISVLHRERLQALNEKIGVITEELALASKPARKQSQARHMPVRYDNPEVQQLRLQQEQLKMRVTEILIQCRNRFVKTERQRNFRRLTGRSETLTVFCVSSQVHQEYLQGYDAYEVPPMSVETTEIPALRTYLRSLPARIKYRHFVAYCANKLPAVLNSVEVACSLNGPERKANWSNIIYEAAKTLDNKVSDITNECLWQSLHRTIVHMNLHEQRWKDDARKICERTWFVNKMVPAGTFKTFMKHHGEHRARKVSSEPISMTERLLQEVRTTCKPHFTTQKTSVIEWSSEAVTAIRNAFAKLEREFKDDPAGNAPALTKFYENMTTSSAQLQKEAQKICNIMKKKTNQCFNKAQVKGVESYIDIALFPVYERCSVFCGKGSTKTRKEEFGKALYGPDSVYSRITQSFRAEVHEIFNEEAVKLNKLVETAMAKMHEDLDEVCHQIVGDSEVGKQLCSDLLALIQPARDVLEKQIKPLLKHCGDVEAGRVPNREVVKQEESPPI